jgi:hypothetical protein
MKQEKAIEIRPMKSETKFWLNTPQLKRIPNFRILVLVCISLFHPISFASDIVAQDQIEKVQIAISSNEFQLAEKLISDLAESKKVDGDFEALLKMKVRYLQNQGERAKILSGLKNLIPLLGCPINIALQLPPQTQLELGWWWSELGQSDKIMLLGNALGDSNNSEKRVIAAILISKAYATMQKWDESVKWSDKAAAFLDSNYSPDWLKSEVGRNQKIARKLRELALFGYGYTLYFEANRQRVAGNFEQAFNLFDKLRALSAENANNPARSISSINDPHIAEQPIDALFGCAARFYSGLCLFEKGSRGETLEYFQKFPAAKGDPYASDIELLRGNIYFDDGDFTGAIECFSGSLKSIEAGKDWQVTLPDNLLKVLTPASDMRPTAKWGNREWFREDPSKLYNIATSPWYADYLRLRIYGSASMAHFALGDVRASLQNLERMRFIDQDDSQLTKSGIPSNYRRLYDGFSSGRFYAEPGELSAFKGKERPTLLRAELAMETEHWAEAERLYKIIDRQFSQSLSLDARAYIDYAIASAELFQNNIAPAKQRLEKFSDKNSEYRKSKSYWRAVFALGSTDSPPNMIIRYEGAMKQSPPPDIDRQLRFSCAQIALGIGDNKRARFYLESIINDKISDYKQTAARQYLKILDGGGLEAYHATHSASAKGSP